MIKNKENSINYKPTERITFVITEKEKVELKIMSIITHRTMSDFIRISINERIAKLKSENIQPL